VWWIIEKLGKVQYRATHNFKMKMCVAWTIYWLRSTLGMLLLKKKKAPEILAKSLQAWLLFDQLSCKFEDIGGRDAPHTPIGRSLMMSKYPIRNFIMTNITWFQHFNTFPWRRSGEVSYYNFPCLPLEGFSVSGFLQILPCLFSPILSFCIRRSFMLFMPALTPSFYLLVVYLSLARQLSVVYISMTKKLLFWVIAKLHE